MILIIDTVGIKSGMNIYNYSLYALFKKHGYFSFIFSNYDSEVSKKIFYDFYKGNILSKISKLALSYFKYIYFLINNHSSYEKIIYQSFGLRIIDIMFILPLFLSNKLYILAHDIHDINKKNIFIYIKKMFYIYIVKKVIIHSTKAKSDLLELGYKNKIFYFDHPKSQVSNRYNLSHIDDDIINSFAKKKVNFLFFGTIRESKGIDTMFRAISILENYYLSKINIVIAGKDDNLLVETELKKHTLIQKNIKFINKRVNDDELIYLFTNSDAILLPYKTIYQSGVLDIAINLKKPIIATNLEYFNKIINLFTAGLTFCLNNEYDFSKKITYFIENEKKYYINYKQSLDIYYNDANFINFINDIF